jgi:hypothetical protein
MSHERMLDRNATPSERTILRVIGKAASLWKNLRDYVADHYDHQPELNCDGKKYGWAIRYRKSGKTLLTLYPEFESFTALVVLGKQEMEKIAGVGNKLSPRLSNILSEATPRKDGRWLWIRPTSKRDIESIKFLLAVKRRPKSIDCGGSASR